MLDRNYFLDLQVSFFRFCMDVVQDWKKCGFTSDMQTFKWDAHPEIPSFPNTDIIGPMDLTVRNEQTLQSGGLMIAVSTLNDKNIQRLDQMVSDLYHRLVPDTRLDLVRNSDGLAHGNIYIKNGTQVMQVLNDDTRATRAISVSFSVDQPLGS